MGVNPDLLVIRKPGDLDEAATFDPGDFLFAGPDNILKRMPTENFYPLLKNTKPISPSDIGPFQPNALYKPSVYSEDPGTNYPNAGNLKAIQGYDTLFFYDGTLWSKIENKLPQATQNIPNFEDLPFPALEGTQAVYQDKLWQVKMGQTATITDIPSEDTSSKWALIGESVLQSSTDTISIKTDTYTTNSYFTNTNTFTGFGFNYGVVKNFNQAIIKVGQIVGTSNPVTEVNIRICEDSYIGPELARVTKSVSIAEGEIQDIAFDLSITIANSGNKNIWIEFWCNGKTGLFKGSTSPVAYRYKTTAHSYSDFATQSTASSANNSAFYLLLNKITNRYVLKNELVADEVSLTDQNPVRSSAVAEKMQGYDEVIVDGFDVETELTLGNENINVQNSTFKGWGQLKGILSNFNRVGYIFRPFDASMIPNTVRCIIRTQSSSGTIIFDQTKNVSLELNVNKKVYFDLPEVYENTSGDEIYISFLANGMTALIGGTVSTDYDNAHAVKYTTSTTVINLPSTVTNLKYQMYAAVIKGVFAKQISETESERIAKMAGTFDSPDLLLTSRAWLYPGFQYNIFEKNVCVPKFGDNNSNYRLNFDGSYGKQLSRGYRIDPIVESLNSTLNLTLLRGRRSLSVKSQLLMSTTASNGTGNSRKVLIIGDSTVNGSNISIPLKSVFDADPMDITLIGTLGAAGVKHEGRGGWRISDYYGQGRVLYRIDVTGITITPGIGARYTQGANTYNVEEVNISGGAGYFSVSIVTGSAPSASGTLTKVSGNGDASINYSSMSQTSANPFYNSTSGKFDIAYYLTNTGQTLTNNDWIFFQLGINDVFSFTDLSSASIKASEMIAQLNEIIANIHTYNANIRIGLVVTFPPADQNAFGESYSIGQFSEMYRKTGLITWQNRMISEYDNATSINNKIYLVSAHLNLDTENNFPTISRPVNSRNTNLEIIQSNGVHPATSGYAQIADMYAGLIKYFG